MNVIETLEAIRNASGDATAMEAQQREAIQAIAKTLNNTDKRVAGYEKAYCASRAALQFVIRGDGHSHGELNKRDKASMGWKDLPAACSAKRKASQLFSAFAFVEEHWSDLPESERNELLAGQVSIFTARDRIRRREKQAEADAKAKAEAEATVAEAKAEGKAEAEANAMQRRLSDIIAEAKARFAEADAEERANAETALIELVELFNSEADADAKDMAEAA